MILRLALPTPLPRYFDYLPPESCPELQPGMRLRVPFGRRILVAMLIAIVDQSEIAHHKLKQALECIDLEPVLSSEDLLLMQWASQYYHHPLGDVIFSALPPALRKGQSATLSMMKIWQLTTAGQQIQVEQLKRAPKQQWLFEALQKQCHTEDQLNIAMANWRHAMRGLQQKNWVVQSQKPAVLPVAQVKADIKPTLNSDQQQAVDAVVADLHVFKTFLLDGVTGSGKTEVYLRIIEQVINEGKQALILVPEIALTPQLIARFQQRFALPMVVMHSGLNERERLQAWLYARCGQAKIIIGTRSAAFTPLHDPGVFIVDEEHDLSFKQQDGFRYSARDILIKRAQNCQLPVVLGSATPALETWHNAMQQRYQYLCLPQRAGDALTPAYELLDLRQAKMMQGLSSALLTAMQTHLARNEQVLLFLNRRGYAPTILCHECGWVVECQRCDSAMTFHQRQQLLICHHCGTEHRIYHQCAACGSPDLRPLGEGTERIESVLKTQFPETPVVRIDRDSTRRKGALEKLLAQIKDDKPMILVGTQMLAKGHHFPNVTLVGILNADSGLFSSDFRASERMAQLILQVSGRAGRAQKPGRVLLQTHQPQHTLLNTLINEGYAAFANTALTEREEALLPPFSYLALLRVEAYDRNEGHVFLRQAKELAVQFQSAVLMLGPVSAPIEKRASRYRIHLLLQASTRTELHGFVKTWKPLLSSIKQSRKVRWSLDIDPLDML